MLSPVTAIALTGLDAAANRLSVAAHNISNMNTDGFKAYVAEDVEVRGRMGVYTAIARPNPPGPQVLDEKGRQKTLSNTDVPHEAVQ